MAAVLGVGAAVLDRLLVLERHPREDEELRATGYVLLPGGNAANTLTVLARLGHRCRLSRASSRTRASASRARAGGSRTIVHYRDLPELGPEHLGTVELAGLDWIHFEGRAPEATATMMEAAREQARGARLSLELEKDRPGLEALLPLPDLVILSRAYAAARGLPGPEEALAWAGERAPQALVVAPWGEAGAWGQAPGGPVVRAPAAPPPDVVDTRGAGDAFVAGLIHALLADLPLEAALAYAARLAGTKCASLGLDGFPLPPLPGVA